uniref:Uncharacterized protein n=1 Tax=Angiostrongylus cantonensis TaxID=6313 RepID=A0A0K0DGF9_ANGCA
MALPGRVIPPGCQSQNTLVQCRGAKSHVYDMYAGQGVVSSRAVFRKALEQIPISVRVWKAVMELEEPDNGLLFLTRRVEWCRWERALGYESVCSRVVDQSATRMIPSHLMLPAFFPTSSTMEYVWVVMQAEEQRSIDSLIAKEISLLETAEQAEISKIAKEIVDTYGGKISKMEHVPCNTMR